MTCLVALSPWALASFVGNAHGFVRRLHDDLVGPAKAGHRRAPADDGERPRLVLGKSAHPLVKDDGQVEVGIARCLEILVRHLAQAVNGGDVLHHVSALAVAERERAHALLQGEQSFENAHRMADAGRHERAGQRTERFAVDGHAVFLVQPHNRSTYFQSVDGIPKRHILRVGNVVGNAAPLEAREAAGKSDFSQKPRIGCAVPHLHRTGKTLGHSPAPRNAVVDDGETVQHRCAGVFRFLDALRSFCITILPCIGVNGCRQKVRLTFRFKEAQQPNVLVDEGHARAGLNQ